ncbi:hypothetical protein nbrc107696_44220 [Gordonia spumicola]|uniref:Uncharacterized protein n=1 Tax=Gordonia spumicola TaxID=589161 RepID=A0A7I9VF77_9ACTN|nr:hypothetical protein [Gordonia spumicola]GEE03976.1 hypothetical protein nbrc107696_44220 [Gordonia spumicola]
MSTFTDNSSSTGVSVWKIVAIVIAVLAVVSLIGPILHAAFWIGLFALAVIGAYSLFKSKG